MATCLILGILLDCAFETSKIRKIHLISWETIPCVDNVNDEVGSLNTAVTTSSVQSAGLALTQRNPKHTHLQGHTVCHKVMKHTEDDRVADVSLHSNECPALSLVEFLVEAEFSS